MTVCDPLTLFRMMSVRKKLTHSVKLLYTGSCIHPQAAIMDKHTIILLWKEYSVASDSATL